MLLYASATSNGSGIAYLAINSRLTCYKCHQGFNLHAVAYRYIKACSRKLMPKNERRKKLNLAKEHRCIYGYYETVLLSHNALFKHFKTCKEAKNSSIR